MPDSVHSARQHLHTHSVRDGKSNGMPCNRFQSQPYGFTVGVETSTQASVCVLVSTETLKNHHSGDNPGKVGFIMEKKITRTFYTVKLSVVIADKNELVAAALAGKPAQIEQREVELLDTVAWNEDAVKQSNLVKLAAEKLEVNPDNVLQCSFVGQETFMVSQTLDEFITFGTREKPRKACD